MKCNHTLPQREKRNSQRQREKKICISQPTLSCPSGSLSMSYGPLLPSAFAQKEQK